MDNESMNKEDLDNILFNNTKIAAYHLWTLSKNVNTVELWYCAEDIALYFDLNYIMEPEDVFNIRRLGILDEGYIHFIRNIAYRLHVYTKNTAEVKNWEDAEALIQNLQWVSALTTMARVMRNSSMPAVISTWVKNHYKNQ